MAARHDQEIACQQVLLDDASVFSVQWSVFPEALAPSLTAERLLERYLAYIRGCTAGCIRPHVTPDGIEFRLLSSRLSLITFLPPAMEPEATVLRICGGLLVQQRECGRGELRFGAVREPGGVRVSLQLSDFCPLILGGRSPSRLRRWLYRGTQAFIHRLVTVRFLAMLYRELCGASARVRVVPARVRDGRPT